MIFPFISSLGRAKTLTVLSEVYSLANRDNAVANGVSINGLPILAVEPDFLNPAHGEEGHVHDAHCEHDDHDHHHDHHHHDHAAPSAIHDVTVASVSLSSDAPLDDRKFFAWFQTLLAQQGGDILRSKGILAFKGEDRRYVVQAVHMMADGDHQKPWRADEKRVSRLVLIGRNLDRAALEQDFASCVA